MRPPFCVVCDAPALQEPSPTQGLVRAPHAPASATDGSEGVELTDADWYCAAHLPAPADGAPARTSDPAAPGGEPDAGGWRERYAQARATARTIEIPPIPLGEVARLLDRAARYDVGATRDSDRTWWAPGVLARAEETLHGRGADGASYLIRGETGETDSLEVTRITVVGDVPDRVRSPLADAGWALAAE